MCAEEPECAERKGNMRKQKIQLVVLLAAFLLFALGFYAAKSISAREEEKDKILGLDLGADGA